MMRQWLGSAAFHRVPISKHVVHRNRQLSPVRRRKRSISQLFAGLSEREGPEEGIVLQSFSASVDGDDEKPGLADFDSRGKIFTSAMSEIAEDNITGGFGSCVFVFIVVLTILKRNCSSWQAWQSRRFSAQ